MAYDAIVIGSGIGGLYAASLLSKEGLKVAVLERHSVAGGLMQCFRRGGEWFPSGVHYIGALGKGQILERYLKYAGVLDKVTFSAYGRNCFDEYAFPDFQIQVPAGHAAFEERFVTLFPKEKKAIAQFMSDMREICHGFALYNMRPPSELRLGHQGTLSLHEYLHSITNDERLRLALSANNMLYGLPPEECPLFLHFLVLDSFLQGTYRVNGGSSALADAFVETLKGFGAEVRTSAEVTEICLDAEGVTGVRLADGEILESKQVIFTGHSKHIFGLLPPHAFRPAYGNRLLSLEETVSTFGVCLLLKEPKSVLEDHNLYLYSHEDISHCYQQTLTDDMAKPEMVFCSGSCKPDSTQATATLLTPMSFSEVSRWKDSRLGARPSDYREMKEKVADKVVAFVKSRVSGGLGDFKITSTFSPLTFRDYVGAWEGSTYGIKKSVSQLRSSRIMPRTRVKGLFLAGQNVEMAGIVGTVIGSVSCCSEILGAEYLLGKIKRETE